MESNNTTTTLLLKDFQLWSTNALKVFLRVRNKPTDGDFDELTARAYVASQECVSVNPVAEHEERALLAEYHAKYDSFIPDDPLVITSGWIGEKEGMCMWPSLYYTDMSRYISILAPEFIFQLETEYKLGKAYRYFACELAREIFIYDINQSKCILKCKVIPSHRMNSKPYDVWAILEKDLDEKPGGKIHTSYCTCTAGLLGCCNHVFAMLFRVECAVTTGVAKPSSTSSLCKWNIPTGSKLTTKPTTPTADIPFAKSTYTSSSDKTNTKKESLQVFKGYSPSLLKQHQVELDDIEATREKLHEALFIGIKDSCFSENILGSRFGISERNETRILPSLGALASVNFYNAQLSVAQNVSNFLTKINITDNDINIIFKKTVSQSENPIWYEQRKGRITASNFHRVYTRSISLHNDPSQSSDNLVDAILQLSVSKQTYAMKHGIALEPHAKRELKSMFLHHKNIQLIDVGLFISKSHPFIGASADAILKCDCCGTFIVEIKCPYSIKDEVPSSENLEYLVKHCDDDGGEHTRLKLNHKYYYQIQGQMGVMHVHQAYFFVFTHHGHHLEKITFNNELWDNILYHLNSFWLNHVGPALLLPYGKKNSQTHAKSLMSLLASDKVQKKKKTNKPCDKSKLKTKTTASNKIICGTCLKTVVHIPKSPAQDSINCSSCEIWYHVRCTDEIGLDGNWKCTFCSDM